MVLQTIRHEIRTLNGNREVLMVQTKELWSQMCLSEGENVLLVLMRQKMKIESQLGNITITAHNVYVNRNT